MEFFIEIEVGGVNGVEIRTRGIDELHFRWVGSSTKRINLDAVSEQFAGKIWFAVLEESTQQNPNCIAA